MATDSPEETATIGVDVGGTNIVAARVTGGRAGCHHKRPTPTGGPRAVAEAVVAAVTAVGTGLDTPVTRVGVGVPGIVDPRHGTLRSAPNLGIGPDPVAFAALVLQGLAEAGHDTEVRVDNDVNAAVRGEWLHGAGRRHDDLLAVWWGTGVGGGFVLDGRLHTGVGGAAGEIGHIVVVPDGRPCACGGRGHVEAYAGRAALEARARHLADAGQPTCLIDLAGDGPMKSSHWAEALEADDTVATDLITEGAAAIARGIATAVTLVDVGLVVLGGGLGDRLGATWATRIGDRARAATFGAAPVDVVGSALGDDAGVVGAAALFD